MKTKPAPKVAPVDETLIEEGITPGEVVPPEPEVKPPPPAYTIATRIGNEIRSPKGSVLGRVNAAAKAFRGDVQFMPIAYEGDVEVMGPTLPEAQAWAWLTAHIERRGWSVQG